MSAFKKGEIDALITPSINLDGFSGLNQKVCKAV